jgi:alkanesulfonate monooxygenase SsuD/methylene tetrahydromethanopterin reductase-like flavin-dependent oxidoreductase (luciferase family)
MRFISWTQENWLGYDRREIPLARRHDVKFGLMTQLQIPRPSEPQAERTAYRNLIDQGVAGESAGFHYFWLTEMHFFKQIGHSPCPDLLHAAISQRTQRIRLGFAVLLLTLHNPYMLAERVATVDVLSNGRVDFGFGRGSTPYMTEAFGVKGETNRDLAAEALTATMKMFEQEEFPGHKGKHFDLPPRHVLPRLIQQPHPPLWIAASNLSTYKFAAEQGVGVIGVTRNSVSETRDAIRTYRETIRGADRSKFIGKFANEHLAAFAITCCHEDDRTGKDIACAAARWYNGDNDAELNRVRFATAGGKDAVVAKFRARNNDQLLEDGMAIGGNPDSISRQVEKWAKAGLDQMIFVLQAGNTTHEQVMRSIELIGRKVIPRFESAPTTVA